MGPRRGPRVLQRRPPGPPQAGRPGLEVNRLLLHATCYNTSLHRILIVVSSQFDPPDYKPDPRPPEAEHPETLIHYLQIGSERGVPQKENLSRASFQEED
jgi:hypothetical protein